MLSLILGFITGLAGPISSAVNKISDLKIAQEQTKSNNERNEINRQIEEVHDRKAVLVAEAGHRLGAVLNASVRLALTIGPASLLLKVFLWDKVIGSFMGCAGPKASINPGCYSFRTDTLDPNLWLVISAVIAFYFIYDITAKAMKK